MKDRKRKALKKELFASSYVENFSNYCWQCEVCKPEGIWNSAFGNCINADNSWTDENISLAKPLKGKRMKYLVNLFPQNWYFCDRPRFNRKRKYLLAYVSTNQVVVRRW